MYLTQKYHIRYYLSQMINNKMNALLFMLECENMLETRCMNIFK